MQKHRGYEKPHEPHDIVFALLLCEPILTSIAAKMLDHTVLQRTLAGEIEWSSDGQYARLIGIIMSLGVAVGCFAGLVKAAGRPHVIVFAAPLLMTIVGSWIILLAFFRHEYQGIAAAAQLLTVPILLIWATVKPGTRRRRQYLTAAAVIVPISNIVYTFAQWSLSTTPCRADKCGLLGVNVQGYFPHENFFGMFIAILMPALRRLPHYYRFAGVAISGVAVLISGSRAVIPMAIAGGVFALWPESGKGERPKWLGLATLVPISVFAFSTTIFFVAPYESFTGRGQIWALVRQAWEQFPWQGPGGQVLLKAYQSGLISFLPTHEHGEGPYMFGRGGLVAWFIFAVALVAIRRLVLKANDLTAAGMFVCVGLAMATETLWEFDIRTPFIFSMIFIMGLSARDQVKSAPRRVGLPYRAGEPLSRRARPRAPRPRSASAELKAHDRIAFY